MKFNRSTIIRVVMILALTAGLAGLSSRLHADTGTCGGATTTLPFTDVSGTNIFFCSIASAYFAGLTNGTTPTTYNPSDPVPREQMAAFVTRTLDQSVKRSHPRAALGEWWVNRKAPRDFHSLGGLNPRFLASDGQAVWSSLTDSNVISRFDIKDMTLICTVDGIPSPEQIVIIADKVWIASAGTPGAIYGVSRTSTLDETFASPFFVVGNNPVGMAFDGENLWTANGGTGPFTGSISKATFRPDSVTTFPTGFNQPRGILFDGTNLWVTDSGDASLKRVDRNTGAILQTIVLSGSVQHPVFDGTNLWIPSAATPAGVPDQLFVVRGVGGLIGTVLATLTGNGLNGPFQAAFDGERVCVTDANGPSVSLWKATDLSPITTVVIYPFSDGSVTRGICSDGTTFLIGLRSPSNGYILRF